MGEHHTCGAFQQYWRAFLDFLTLSESLLAVVSKFKTTPKYQIQPDSWLCTHLPQYFFCVALGSSENVHIVLGGLRKCAQSNWQVQNVWAHMLLQNCKLWSLRNSLEHIITGHSLESSISADTHIPARRARYLRLSSATLKKCCGTCARSQLQCLRYYHGPDFF